MIRKTIIVALMLLTLLVLLIGWITKNDIITLDPRVFRDSFSFAGWSLAVAWAASQPLGIPHRWAFGGFEYDYLFVDGVTIVFIPLWVFACLFALYPTIAFIRGPLRRHRRQRKGQCLQCGYSLEGNVTGVCPECGVET